MRIAKLVLFVLTCTVAQGAETRVDPRTGELRAAATDLSVRAGGVVIEVRRELPAEQGAGAWIPGWVTNWDAGPGAQGDAVWKVTLDGAGRVSAREDANGNRIVAQRSADGRLTRLEGPHGAWIAFTGGEGGPITATASTGESVVYTMAGGHLDTVTLPDGRKIGYGYDAAGRLASVSDPSSGTVKMERDGEGRVTKRTFADGLFESYAYDGTRTTVTDEHGSPVTYEYSADGRRIVVSDRAGATSTSDLDGEGRIVRTTGPGGEARVQYNTEGRVSATVDATGTTQFTYGEDGRVASVVHPDGTMETIKRDATGNPVSMLVNGTEVAAMEYAADGQPVRIRTTTGVRSFVYDQAGRVSTITDSLGRTTRFEYNARGAVVKETNAAGGVTALSYDGLGMLLTVTDPLGRVTAYGYDSAGRVNQETDPSGIVTRYTYDARGRRTGSEMAGKKTATTADTTANTVSTALPGGSTESVRFDPDGRFLETITASGQTIREEYDARGEVAKLVGPRGSTTDLKRDGQGRVTSVEQDGKVKASYEWDASGRLSAIRDAAKGRRSWTYDSQGRVTAGTDALGNKTVFERDGGGRVAATTMPGGARTAFAYDSEGQLVEIERPGGVKSKLGYDALGNLASLESPGGVSRRCEYNAAGELVKTTDGAGRTVEYHHDAGGRLSEVVPSSGAAVRYSHDAEGRVTRMDDGADPVEYVYNEAGAVTEVVYPALSGSVKSAWNAAGQRTSLTATDGRTIGYVYDKGEPVEIRLPDGGALRIAYDVQGRTDTVTFPNGIESKYGYDDAGRISSLEHRGKKGTVRKWTTSYDAAGRPSAVSESGSGRSSAYSYDRDGRIAKGPGASGEVSYVYTEDGSRASTGTGSAHVAYTYSEGLLVSAGDERFGHDGAGFMASRESAGTSARYEYDAFGRLAGVKRPVGDVRFSYDAAGQRASRTDAKGRTRFVYFEDHLLEEIDDAGAVTALYVHGPGVDWPLAVMRGGRTYFYHMDCGGSVAFLSDAEGSVVAGYEYDAYGVMLAHSGDVPNPLLYKGREYDKGLGLYYCRARWYDPSLGRFLSPDPELGDLEEPDSLNPYVYALNAPTVYRDPSGAVFLAELDMAYWYDRYGIRGRDLLQAVKNEYQRMASNPEGSPIRNNADRVRVVRQASSRVQVALERAEMLPGRYQKAPHMMRSMEYQLSNRPGSGNGSLLPKPPQTGYTPLTTGRGSPVPTRAEGIRQAIGDAMGRIGSWFQSGGGGGTPGNGGSAPGGSGTRAMQAPRAGGDTLAVEAPGSVGGARSLLTGIGRATGMGGVIGAIVNGAAALLNGRSAGEATVAAAQGGVIGAAEGAAFGLVHNALVAAAANSTRPILAFLGPRVIPIVGAVQVGTLIGRAGGNWVRGNKPGDAEAARRAEEEAAAAEAANAAQFNDPSRAAASAANAAKWIEDLRTLRSKVTDGMKRIEEEHGKADSNGKKMDEWIAKGSKKVIAENPALTGVQGPEGKPGLQRHCMDAAGQADRIAEVRDKLNQKSEEILKAFETDAEPPNSTPSMKIAATNLTEMAVEIGKLKKAGSELSSALAEMKKGFDGAEKHSKWVGEASKSIEEFGKQTLAIQSGATAVEADAKAFDEKKANLLRMLVSLQSRVPDTQKGLFTQPINDARAMVLPEFAEQLAEYRKILPEADARIRKAKDVIKEIDDVAKDELSATDNYLAQNGAKFSNAVGVDSIEGIKRTVKKDLEEIDATFEAIKFVVARRQQKVKEWLDLGQMILTQLGPKKVAEAEAAKNDKMKAEAEKLMAEAAERNTQDKAEAVVLQGAEKSATEAQAEVAPTLNLLGIGGN